MFVLPLCPHSCSLVGTDLFEFMYVLFCLFVSLNTYFFLSFFFKLHVLL